MAQSTSAAQKESVCKNDFSHRMLEKLIKSKAPDVQFVFKGENGDVKIPAHKELLAVSSPVFDAMFNGELKEKGDVPIADASVAGFSEFIQFFYSDRVKLTMDNITDVLNLAHKYDVIAGFQAAIKFLMKNLTSDKIMWGLQLAIKYPSDELKAFCMEQIKKDPINALDVFDSQEAVIPTTNPLDTSSASMLAEVLSVAKKVIVNQSAEIHRLRTKCILPLVLASRVVQTDIKISPEESFTFDFHKYESAGVMLSEIFPALITDMDSNRDWSSFHLTGTVLITERPEKPSKSPTAGKILFEKQFGKNARIALPEPIIIRPNHRYTITMKPSVCGHPPKRLADLPYLANNFELRVHGKPTYTLIERLHFEAVRDWKK